MGMGMRDKMVSNPVRDPVGLAHQEKMFSEMVAKSVLGLADVQEATSGTPDAEDPMGRYMDLKSLMEYR